MTFESVYAGLNLGKGAKVPKRSVKPKGRPEKARTKKALEKYLKGVGR